MANKPTAAFVLLLIGGLIVLGGACLSLAAGLTASSIASTSGSALTGAIAGAFGIVGEISGALGVICGILMLLSGIMTYRTPAKAKTWGVVGLVFSIISLGNGGGFVIGFILGLIGGILALVFKS